MMIELKISQKLMSFVKILMTLSLVFILFCEGVFSKRSLATTVSQIDKFVTKNKKYKKSKMLSDSFDQICLPAYLQLFSGNVGRFNSTNNHTIFDNLNEANYQFIKHECFNSHNGVAFDSYLVTQSIFISDIQSPVNESEEDDLIQYSDLSKSKVEVELGAKADYYYLSNFWMKYYCSRDPEYSSKMFNIQSKLKSIINILNSEYPQEQQIFLNDIFINSELCEFTEQDVNQITPMAKIRNNELIDILTGESNFRQQVNDKTPRNMNPENVFTFSDDENIYEEEAEIDDDNEVVAEGNVVRNMKENFGAGGMYNQDYNVNEFNQDFDQDFEDNNFDNNVADAGEADLGQNAGNNPGAQAEFGNAWNGFNIFGRAFSFIRNFWNDRVRTPHMKRFEKQNSNVNIDALLQEEAENLNSADVYMLLGEIYLFGNSKLGVKQNFGKALLYMKMAAELGDKSALYIIGLVNISDNSTLAELYLTKCAEMDFGPCYFGLGTLYQTLSFEKLNITKSVEYYTKAYELDIYEATFYLAILYGTIEETLNFTLSEFYVKEAIDKTDGQLINELFAQYLLNRINGGDVEFVKYFAEYIANTQTELDVTRWHNLGLRKFYLGDFDRAYMIFSFASQLGSIESTKAAAYIWYNGLTKQLHCKLNSNYICATFNYFDGLIRKDSDSGIGMAKALALFKDSYTGSNPEIITGLDELIYTIYDIISEFEVTEGIFAKASLLYEGIGVEQNKTEALSIFDKLIDDSMSEEISKKNLMPLYIKKYFLITKSMVMSLRDYLMK